MFVTSYNLREGVVCGGIGMGAGGAGVSWVAYL